MAYTKPITKGTLSINEILRHPAYKHGFESHRKFKNAGEPQHERIKFDLRCPNEFGSTGFDTSRSELTPGMIWLLGAHAGMKNSNGLGEIYGFPSRENLDPLPPLEETFQQLSLFDEEFP